MIKKTFLLQKSIHKDHYRKEKIIHCKKIENKAKSKLI